MSVWCVVDCEPGREEVAKRHLEDQGFNVFQPYYIRTIRHARKELQVKKYLLFQYALVEVDLDAQPWRSINGTRGVSHILLGSNQRPGIISEKEMDRIRATTAMYNEDLPGLPPLSKDQVVKIIAGAFNQFEATVSKTSADGSKVEVKTSLFGRPTKTTVPRDALEPV